MASDIELELSPNTPLNDPAREVHHFQLGGPGKLDEAVVRVGDLVEVAVPIDANEEYEWSPSFSEGILEIWDDRDGEVEVDGQFYRYWDFAVLSVGETNLIFNRSFLGRTPKLAPTAALTPTQLVLPLRAISEIGVEVNL